MSARFGEHNKLPCFMGSVFGAERSDLICQPYLQISNSNNSAPILPNGWNLIGNGVWQLGMVEGASNTFQSQSTDTDPKTVG